MLSTCTAMQTVLQKTLTRAVFMKAECNKLLDCVNNLMSAANSVEDTKWTTKLGADCLARLESLLKDSQTLMDECRQDGDRCQTLQNESSYEQQQVKGGRFTTKNQLAKKRQKIQETFEVQIAAIQRKLSGKFQHLRSRLNNLRGILVSLIYFIISCIVHLR